MAAVVVDTSTVVKWYIPEQHYEQARELCDDFLNGNHELFSPALLPFEAVNAFNDSGYYDGKRLVEAADPLRKYGIEMVPLHSVGPLADIENSLGIIAFDPAYVALAVERDATADTADRKLLSDLEGSENEHTATHIQTYQETEFDQYTLDQPFQWHC